MNEEKFREDINNDAFIIKTKTTGFGSPARAYSKKRCNPTDLLVDDPFATFFFKWDGDSKFGLIKGEYLVVDRNSKPEINDLVIFDNGLKLGADIYKNIDPKKIWGVITWRLCKIKK